MAMYIALGTYTDQGFREIDKTVSRTEDFKTRAIQFGMSVKDVFWMRPAIRPGGDLGGS